TLLLRILCYPQYLSGDSFVNVDLLFMPLLDKNEFLLDYTNLDEEVLDRAKMMFLNYPNKPTAAVASEDFFEETVEVAKKHNVFVVHDFAEGARGIDGVKHPSC